MIRLVSNITDDNIFLYDLAAEEEKKKNGAGLPASFFFLFINTVKTIQLFIITMNSV